MFFLSSQSLSKKKQLKKVIEMFHIFKIFVIEENKLIIPRDVSHSQIFAKEEN